MSGHWIGFFRGGALGVVAGLVTDSLLTFAVVLVALIVAFGLTDEVRR